MKIQRLPFSLWQDIKDADTPEKFVQFLKDNYEVVQDFIGTRDWESISKRNTLNKSSMTYIFGHLTSKILRGGGSKLTQWSIWCYTDKDTLEFERTTEVTDLTLEVKDRITFNLSPWILRVGGKYYEQLEKSSQLIHNAVAGNVETIVEQLDNPTLAEVDKIIKRQTEDTEIGDVSNQKICAKVDYTIMHAKDNKLTFVPIDVNDLHGGLHWIDLFKKKYEEVRGKELVHVDYTIPQLFAKSCLDYYKSVKGELPQNILVCLDDLERWNQDNGLNYLKIKEAFEDILKSEGIKANAFISYVKNYQDCLTNYKKTGKIKIQKVNEKNGEMSEKYSSKIDLVVRIYRKLYGTGYSYITTKEFLGQEPPFLIYDPEELRPAYYKENVYKVFQNNKLKKKLKDQVTLPSLIGYYNLSEKNLADKIIKDVIKSGADDFLVKLPEKTPYTKLSVFFFSAKNELHKMFLEDILNRIKKQAKDLDHIVVEPHYGTAFGAVDAKVELRTVNVQLPD